MFLNPRQPFVGPAATRALAKKPSMFYHWEHSGFRGTKTAAEVTPRQSTPQRERLIDCLGGCPVQRHAEEEAGLPGT